MWSSMRALIHIKRKWHRLHPDWALARKSEDIVPLDFGKIPEIKSISKLRPPIGIRTGKVETISTGFEQGRPGGVRSPF
jgi:hypothetical protein